MTSFTGTTGRIYANGGNGHSGGGGGGGGWIVVYSQTSNFKSGFTTAKGHLQLYFEKRKRFYERQLHFL